MSNERILNNDQFFSEIHTNFSNPVKIINKTGLGELVGQKVDVHLHSPATEKLEKPIYSVLVGGRVEGHAEDIYLKDAKMQVDKRQLAIHLASKTPENPKGSKTRNTFTRGTVVYPAPIEPAEKPLKVRPGSMTDADTGEDVSTGMSGVRLTVDDKGKPSTKYKPVI
jgi:hypothetical protein